MTALLFWLIYKEKLLRQHLFGMTLIVFSVITVALGKTQHTTTATEISLTILAPLTIVFINCLLLTFSSFAARSSKSCGFPPMHFVADFSLVAGVLYVLGYFLSS